MSEHLTQVRSRGIVLRVRKYTQGLDGPMRSGWKRCLL